MAIRDHLPKRQKMTNFQVKMPEKLVRDVQKEMKTDNYETWQDFLTACFKAYLEQKKEQDDENDDDGPK